MRSKRAPESDRPLLETLTNRSDVVVVEEDVQTTREGGFLLHDSYILEVDGTDIEGGVAAHKQEFVMEERETIVKVPYTYAVRGRP